MKTESRYSKNKKAMVRAWEMFKRNNKYGHVFKPFGYFLRKAWRKVKALAAQEVEFESWDISTL